jgi:hypothetical protein
LSNPLLGATPGPTPAARATAALPPALTYLLARTVADSDHRAQLGRPPATARLERLLHDAERALETGGLAGDEVDAAMAFFASRTAAPNEAARERRAG